MKNNKYLDSFIEKNKDVLFIEKNTNVCEKDFLKVYIASNSVLSSLTNSTKIVYEYLFRRLQDRASYNITKLIFTFRDYTIYCNDNDIKAVPEASFYRARNELVKNDIIDNTDTDGYYFFNVNYFFNGDRIQVALNYIKTTHKEIKGSNVVLFKNNVPVSINELDDWELIKKQAKLKMKSAFQS